MSNSPLTLSATEDFRRRCLNKNLKPYTVPGSFTPNTSTYETPIRLSNYSVIDSPNVFISNAPFVNQFYPLNNYGPDGGYTNKVSIDYPSSNATIRPNQGEYDPNETDMDLKNETSIDNAYNENKYGPDGGFNLMYFVTDNPSLNRIHLPYWEPPTFIPSTYAPAQILLSMNPIGNSGLLSQDSYLAKISSLQLKKLLEERINVERAQNITSSLIANYSITIPETPLSKTTDLVSRMDGSYSPTSPIPGSYFDENEKKGTRTNQTSVALGIANTLTGGLLGPILNIKRNPSQIFLANTGSGQKQELFKNLNINRFQPNYSKFSGGVLGITTFLGTGVKNLLDNVENGYYVGSAKKEPSSLSSPRNQIPVDEFGRQVSAPVYGPTDLSLLYEGNETKLLFGLGGIPTTDGGGIDGQFVWTSPKYRNSAGYKATPGGGKGKKDEEFFLVSSQYQKNQSIGVELKKGSILDETQRLINSADKVSGRARLKHVGNAINQVSKVFNDGYKEMTRGSKVLSYVDNSTGREAGIEYARVFTKDTPYYTYKDLQKTEGITTSNRRFTNSVFDNTFNLNIAPLRNPNSTNLIQVGNTIKAKKYMFSIENLAWRTSPLYDDLPSCEKGPNGGRIMWFPPYDIKFSDQSSASFQGTSFLGRPEQIYTYKETSRSGTLSWKIVVDHPSILNVIVRKQLKGVTKERIDSIVNSFFAGAAKYDIYELAKRFPTIPKSTIDEITKEIESAKNKQATEKAASQLANNQPDAKLNNDLQLQNLKQEFEGYGWYFPKTYQDGDVFNIVQSYVDSNISNAFVTSVVQSNLNTLNNFVTSVKGFTSSNEGTMIIVLDGSVVNEGQSTARFQSGNQLTIVENTLNNQLKSEIDTKKILIRKQSLGIGTSVSPKNDETTQGAIDCRKLETVPNSLQASACRRVIVKEIKFVPKNPAPQQSAQQTQELKTGNKPESEEDLFTGLRKGISKRLLRFVLNECDYFDMIKENAPMVYDSIQEKLKYFEPGFHSTTPEGLNSRLVFLNQCVRPGETIPVIGPDGNPVTSNASNTSFGAPPILVLRIGDFYHTKIVPDGVSFSYDPINFDINPEGIGIQPMIVSVSMNFKMIGGMGIAKPVERLQNALSFNYYANTEIYDERAEETENRDKIDKEIFDALKLAVNKKPTPDNQQSNNNGATIGTDSGSNLNYKNIMDKLLTSTRAYFETVVNTLESINNENNYGVVQILNAQRQYSLGSLQKSPFNTGNIEVIQIYGKPANWELAINNTFSNVLSSIDDNSNPIIDFLSKFFPVNDDSFPIRDVKTNMKEYINNLSVDFSVKIATKVQELTTLQQGYVQNIRKLNVVVNKTDGKQNAQGTPDVYNISGSEYNTLVTDYLKLKPAMDRYVTLLEQGDEPIAFNQFQQIKLIKTNKFNTQAKIDFFIVMSRILTDNSKKQEFIDFVIKNDLKTVKNPVRLENKFKNIVNDLEDLYKDELRLEKRIFRKLKDKQEYKNLTNGISRIMYNAGKDRNCPFNKTPSPNDSIQKELLTNLFSSQNNNDDNQTFDGKITFN